MCGDDGDAVGAADAVAGDAGVGDDLYVDDVVEVDAVEVLDFKAVDHQQGCGVAVDGAAAAGGYAFEEVRADGFDVFVHRSEVEPGLVAGEAVVYPFAGAAGGGEE